MSWKEWNCLFVLITSETSSLIIVSLIAICLLVKMPKEWLQNWDLDLWPWRAVYGGNLSFQYSFCGAATLLQQSGPKSCAGFSGSRNSARGCIVTMEEDCNSPTRVVVERKLAQSPGLKLSLGWAHRFSTYAVNQLVSLISECDH